MSLKCGKGLEQGRGSSPVWSHPITYHVRAFAGVQKKIAGEKQKRKKKEMSWAGMEVGKKVLHVAYGSLKPMVVFCDSHKQVIIVPFYFLF